MNMELVNVIEQIGARLDSGEIDMSKAVDALMDASGGGLTRAGCADILRNWKTSRAQYDSVFRTVEITMLTIMFKSS